MPSVSGARPRERRLMDARPLSVAVEEPRAVHKPYRLEQAGRFSVPVDGPDVHVRPTNRDRVRAPAALHVRVDQRADVFVASIRFAPEALELSQLPAANLECTPYPVG